MSYYSKPVFFYAYNSTAQTVGVGSLFGLDTFESCAAGPSTGEVDISHKAYLYGEIQTDVGINTNNYDTAITNNELLTHQGYQIRNNGQTGAMDDGVYAQVSSPSGIELVEYRVYTSDKSDAYQTRLYGVHLS